MFIHNCDFCDELSGGSNNAFAKIYKQQPRSRILYRSQSFVLLPSLGQIAEGHLLIVPTRHHTALADMSSSSVDELSEFRNFVRLGLAQAYGPTVFFEHGIRGTQSGGCGIDHAHMHAVPTSLSKPMEALRKNHLFKPIVNFSEITQQVSPNSPYLYYEETSGEAWTCEVDFIPSQYLRKLLAESIGTDSWDWRKCGREEALITSLERLSEFFYLKRSSLNEDSLPSRSAKAVIAGSSS
jgi:diadenosine tetraphosphate (Ap4A) HIT family hydrolase